ncbi:MAG: homoserine dehydrogenase [Deltaproteobacteria bacterium]|nr:MAG: homoserine dehydrogenase [Deltaproteobacteria bacterium]
MKEIKVGLIGFGTVGTGVVKILQENASVIEQRLGGRIYLYKIADIDLKRDRGVQVPTEILTSDVQEVIANPEISIVLELIGGIEPARTFILKAMESGKHVVTANKALLALHREEIFTAAQKYGVRIGFEASVGGGIPIIRSIREGLVANKIISLFGILNGTSNYILTRMTQEGKGFRETLKEAQRLGYAEADPTLDVEGIDAAHKLSILASLAFGIKVDFQDIFVEGISHITPLDIQFSREFGYRVKLLAIGKWDGGRVELRVHPTMLPADHLLSTVEGVYNAIYIFGDAVGPTMFYGQGAGGLPTGSAVVSDLVDLCRDIIKGLNRQGPLITPFWSSHQGVVKDMEEVVTPYYLRFTAVDRPGVLSKISGILGEHEISIASVIQKGRRVKGAVPIVMMTHEATERNIRRALHEINRLDVIRARTTLIRVEGEVT